MAPALHTCYNPKVLEIKQVNPVTFIYLRLFLRFAEAPIGCFDRSLSLGRKTKWQRKNHAAKVEYVQVVIAAFAFALRT